MESTFFESQRKRLLALAYRFLGSVSEAEDAVQETYLKWQATDRVSIAQPAAWLTTCCSRQSLDMLKHAQRARTEYVGTWLPEPLHALTEDTPEHFVELANTVSTAFLLLLERLTPKERAAYLLREIFDMPYGEVATALEISEAACRQLVSRGRGKVGSSSRYDAPPAERQAELLAAFQHAVSTGEVTDFSQLLAKDVELSADGGGKVPTLGHVLHGADEVLAFVRQLGDYWRNYTWQFVGFAGGAGLLLREGRRLTTAVTFGYDGSKVSGIYILRNPDKLRSLDSTAEAGGCA